MQEPEKLFIFLCSGAAKAGDKKLSYRIASRLAGLGIGEIGTLSDLGQQHSAAPEIQRRMIFINDCRSGCVNVLTHGFDKGKFIFLDVAPFFNVAGFDIEKYIDTEIFPQLHEKWAYTSSLVDRSR